MPDDLFSGTHRVGELSTGDEAFCSLKADELRAVTRHAVVKIGSILIEVKERIGYGHFSTWLNREFQWGHSSAAKFMLVAQAFGKFPVTATLSIDKEALALLAGPSVSEGVRDAAVERAEAGEMITKAEAENKYRCTGRNSRR